MTARIVYMGTPDFAVAPLLALRESGRDISLAVTQPDRPRDRGGHAQPPPVKKAAEALGIAVSQPETIKENGPFLEMLNSLAPDIIIVTAYGRMLPPGLLRLPRLGCVNIHASLLPKYRGAAPIQRAVMNGEKETGVTLTRMTEEMDAGGIIAVRKTEVGGKSSSELFSELSLLGASLLTDSLPAIESGEADAAPQDHSLATYAPMLRKEEGHVDFTRPPEETERLVRAMNTWPGAYAFHAGVMIKIWESAALDEACGLPPGTVASVSRDGIAVSAGGKTLLLTGVQAPGKRALAAADFLRGNRIEPGSVFT